MHLMYKLKIFIYNSTFEIIFRFDMISKNIYEANFFKYISKLNYKIFFQKAGFSELNKVERN